MPRQQNKTVYLLLACAVLCALGGVAVAGEVDYYITATPTGYDAGTWTVYANIVNSTVSAGNPNAGDQVYGITGFDINVTATGNAAIQTSTVVAPVGSPFPYSLIGFGYETGNGTHGLGIYAYQNSMGGPSYVFTGVGASSGSADGAAWTQTAHGVEVATGTYTTGPGGGLLQVVDASEGGLYSSIPATNLLVGSGPSWTTATYADIASGVGAPAGVVAVPEPSTLAGLITGAACGLGLLVLRRRRTRRPQVVHA